MHMSLTSLTVHFMSSWYGFSSILVMAMYLCGRYSSWQSSPLMSSLSSSLFSPRLY